MKKMEKEHEKEKEERTQRFFAFVSAFLLFQSIPRVKIRSGKKKVGEVHKAWFSLDLPIDHENDGAEEEEDNHQHHDLVCHHAFAHGRDDALGLTQLVLCVTQLSCDPNVSTKDKTSISNKS
eukprot:TRINITY_DN9750_c0_g2_i2.p1 TRINITY_DN9750_c0_g2~~TRINITY_DN9750_c0_g2_i2.p1  ORF type:complete len:122 (+),score=17.52 TRINITY_DN9750_c0_g2_i2:146-511(+)